MKRKEEEARELEKKLGKKKAREVAEKHFQMKIEEIQKMEVEEERNRSEVLKRNRER